MSNGLALNFSTIPTVPSLTKLQFRVVATTDGSDNERRARIEQNKNNKKFTTIDHVNECKAKTKN